MTEAGFFLLLFALAAVLLVCPVVLHRRRRTRVSASLLAVSAGILALWTANLVVIAADYRDADAFVDCTDCSVLQRGAGLTFSLGLGLLLLVSAVAFALLVADRIAKARR